MKSQFSNIKIAAVFAATLYSQSLVAEESANVIASVNGTPITNEVFSMYVEKRIGVPPGSAFPENKRNEMIQELIQRELIYQDAVNQGLDKQESVLMQIQEQIHNTLTRIRISKLLQENQPSHEMMQEIYQTQIVDPASKEYKARHILSKTADDANAIILSLNKGADFEKLAKEKSTGPSANVGGDLGWFSPNQMVKPFSDAVEKLKPGEHSKRPVETRFGWHVIKLEEARTVEPPPFESVEDQVVKVAQNKIIQDYLDKLRKDANIEVK